MRQSVIFIFLIISISTFGQDEADSTIERKIGFLLDKVQDNTITEHDKKELRMLTFTIQNKGFVLDEMSQDYIGSMVYINQALLIWIASGDTINEANNRKYKGYLLGRLNRFTEAKKEIQLAIDLYQIKNIKYGVAVSHFDLSKVYEYENKIDSALFFADLAMTFWVTKSDTFRILSINNQRINLYRKSKNYINAEQIQKESEKLSKFKNLHWRPLIDFYYVSYQLYKELNNSNLASRYLSLYTDKIELLNKEKIYAESTYKSNL